jgi:hypothetical protein
MVRIISALILAVTAACAMAAEPPKLVDNPPDRHVVVRGDTLWGISGKFLKEPWRWPEIWNMNREQIKNPHLIYPGDVVYLDRSGANPRLRVGKSVSSTAKAQPQVYSEPSRDAIPSIPPHAIEPFISRPLVVEVGQMVSPAMIVATQEERIMMGSGDVAFVSGVADDKVLNWSVYRPGKPLNDPETGEILGYEAFFLGSARLMKPGEPAVMRITEAKEEMLRGDRVLPAPPPTLLSYAPHRTERDVAGRIMTIYGDKTEGGTGAVITVNRGARDGLEVGHVLAIYRDKPAVGYDDNMRRIETRIPEERYGLIFVFRVFDRVAYGLVVSAARPILLGDAVRNP